MTVHFYVSWISSFIRTNFYVIKEYNPSIHTFNVTIEDCSYMFRLLQTNDHQAVYEKHTKEIVLHIVSGRDFGLTKVIAYINTYVCYMWKALFKYNMVLCKVTHFKNFYYREMNNTISEERAHVNITILFPSC
jgi:hypothetical protein